MQEGGVVKAYKKYEDDAEGGPPIRREIGTKF